MEPSVAAWPFIERFKRNVDRAGDELGDADYRQVVRCVAEWVRDQSYLILSDEIEDPWGDEIAG